VERRDLVRLGAAAVGLGLAGCARPTVTGDPAAPPTSTPMRTETIGVIIDPVVFADLKEVVAATGLVLVGTMGPLSTLTSPNPDHPKYQGVPPTITCEATVTVKRVVLDRRASRTTLTECRIFLFGGEVDGVRYVAEQDPLPTIGQDYFLLLLTSSAGMQPPSPARAGVPEVASVMLGDGRWRVGSDGLLSPELGYTPRPWLTEAFANKTVDQAAATVLSVS